MQNYIKQLFTENPTFLHLPITPTTSNIAFTITQIHALLIESFSEKAAMSAFPNPAAFGGFVPMDPAQAWKEYSAPDGRKYYFNSVTQENTWTKPAALANADRESLNYRHLHCLSFSAAAQQSVNLAANLSVHAQIQTQASAVYAGFKEQTAVAQTTNTEKKNERGRPQSSTPVQGSPWCVVWTNDARCFFFNPSTKTSVWDRPPELYNRTDVDLLVQRMPDNENGSDAVKRSLSATNESDEDSKMEHDGNDDDSGSGNDTDGTPAPKKSRKEKKWVDSSVLH